MRILILGGNGMAGHMLVQYFKKQSAYEVHYTCRDPRDPDGIPLDAFVPHAIEPILQRLRPDYVINCIGILNQYAERNEAAAFRINGKFPHEVKEALEPQGGMLIHISTDCVFSGESGFHTENHPPDGKSVYARSKIVGEVICSRHLTIRTSIIGPEVREQGIGLLHWFLQQTGTVHGYVNALWNGVTTLELAKVIHGMTLRPVSGLVHLTAPEPINKYNLLRRFQDVFDKKDVEIMPDDRVVIDRTLLNTRSDFKPCTPPYPHMLRELRLWMRSG